MQTEKRNNPKIAFDAFLIFLTIAIYNLQSSDGTRYTTVPIWLGWWQLALHSFGFGIDCLVIVTTITRASVIATGFENYVNIRMSLIFSSVLVFARIMVMCVACA